MNNCGLDKSVIDQLEAEIDSLDFDSIVSRLDAVLSKGWSYEFAGPEIVQVPKRQPKYQTARKPKVFINKDEPHYQCTCSIIVYTALTPISREYTVLVPVKEDAFSIARDLAFIYAAYRGWGVGKNSKDIFTDEPQAQVVIGIDSSDLTKKLEELAVIKKQLGIKENKELNPFVSEWSNGEQNSILSITKSNIESFTNFLRTKTDISQ